MPRWNLMPQPDADPVMLAQRQQQERYANALSGQLSLAVRDMQTAKDQVEQLIAKQSNDQERAAELQSKLNDMTKKFGTVSDNVLKSSETIRKLESELRKLQKESEVMKLQLKRNREFTNEK
jgi:septal ring factor EnvC (AmiA/AmiB activator)